MKDQFCLTNKNNIILTTFSDCLLARDIILRYKIHPCAYLNGVLMDSPQIRLYTIKCFLIVFVTLNVVIKP